MNYIKIVSALVMSIIFATGIISCRTKAGDPGPAGTNGTPFNYNAGFIKGTASGTTYVTDDAFSNAYNFTYFKDVQDNYIFLDGNNGKHALITRYDATGESYITLQIGLDNQGNIYGETVAVRLITKDAAKNYLYVGTGTSTDAVEDITLSTFYSGGSSAITFANKVIDPSTNSVSFDYTIEIYNYSNTTNNQLTLTGSLSADLFVETTRKGSAE